MGDKQVDSQSTPDISESLPGPAETSQRPETAILDSKLSSQQIKQTTSAVMQQVGSRGSQQAGGHGAQELFDMGALGSALPDISNQNYGNVPLQRHHSATSPQNIMYQSQHMPQFASMNMSNSNSANAIYNIQYSPQYQGHYAMNNIATAQNVSSGMGPNFHFYHMQGFAGQQQPQLAPPYFQQGQYALQPQMYAANTSQGQYGIRPSFLPDHRFPQQGRGRELPVDEPSPSRSSGRSGSNASGSGRSSVVRGPPRKPRQSGHAIWIGNLPPQTDLMSLVHHVCKETPKLESLFLISKSNCAFANFRDEASCAAAQMKIHESRFQAVRLVSRLRRSSVGTAGVSIPTGPAALSPPSFPPQQIVVSSSPEKAQTDSPAVVPSPDGAPKDKYFIVKSLTVEDLELSVRNGIWATQSHNEEALNKAYQSVDNVYLIFSANKSGEYFGYARMASEINDDPAAAIEFAPSVHAVEDPELPKAIPTLATEFTPKGRIIDDSARGTIFWEVEREEGESVDGIEEEDEGESGLNEVDPDSISPPKAWGKPFRIEWISTNRLPFYRTRGLRNPWNSNREVKIARDGTELETSIGRRLTGLFHRTPSPSAMFLPSAPSPLVGGFPPAHPQH